jgi:hypothetical protein
MTNVSENCITIQVVFNSRVTFQGVLDKYQRIQSLKTGYVYSNQASRRQSQVRSDKANVFFSLSPFQKKGVN